MFVSSQTFALDALINNLQMQISTHHQHNRDRHRNIVTHSHKLENNEKKSLQVKVEEARKILHDDKNEWSKMLAEHREHETQLRKVSKMSNPATRSSS